MSHSASSRIGASAGGIEAFPAFFGKMPADSGLAFVVVLHLVGRPQKHAAGDPGTLDRHAGNRSGGRRHRSSRIRCSSFRQARLRSCGTAICALRKIDPDAPRSVAPIDVFFDSVASSLAEDAIGVILSGTGHDGALGLKAIKARGGLTLAQRAGRRLPGPEYPGMPDSAVAAGAVDLYAPVEEMPDRILAARQMRLATLRDADQATPDGEKIRLAICGILRSHLGHDFYQYKHQTFMRRVQRRMQVLRLTSYDDYIRLLKTDREQVGAAVSRPADQRDQLFSRRSVFTALESEIIPRLFEGKDATSELRIWVPGCATGRGGIFAGHPVARAHGQAGHRPKVQIFASDIDEIAIGTARAGRFPATLLEGISPERRARFFIEGPEGYVVRQDVRELCTFSAHSLIRDPPFSRINLISCRNLLIYMDNDLQDRVIPIFHYALVPGGILVLGSSETIAAP